MMQTEQKAAAKAFAAYWKDKGYEKGESQKFWIDLLEHVYGVANISEFISFEDHVKLDHTSFIDGYIPSTHVLIEQKGLGKDLLKGIRQSDGTILAPFQQAKRYAAELPYSQRPRWIVTYNFAEFLVYDMEKPNGEPEQIFLKDLPREYYRLNFLVDTGDGHTKKEMEVSLQAGELVGKLYNAILKQYKYPDSPETLRSLNMLCVRLVFCLYAEDAGLFGKHSMFHDYLKQFPAKNARTALKELFRVLDQKDSERDPYLNEDLAKFPYVNGGLFADENIEISNFTDEIMTVLLENASADFDWSEISPTIFGAVFESTLNPETRRSGGMHYTSHKVIDPLFMNDLNAEFAAIMEYKQTNVRNEKKPVLEPVGGQHCICLVIIRQRAHAVFSAEARQHARSEIIMVELVVCTTGIERRVFISRRRIKSDVAHELPAAVDVAIAVKNPVIRQLVSKFIAVEVVPSGFRF